MKTKFAVTYLSKELGDDQAIYIYEAEPRGPDLDPEVKKHVSVTFKVIATVYDSSDEFQGDPIGEEVGDRIARAIAYVRTHPVIGPLFTDETNVRAVVSDVSPFTL